MGVSLGKDSYKHRLIAGGMESGLCQAKPSRLTGRDGFSYLERLMRLIMIDNYDSFTYNLVQLFYEFDIEVLVFRHDETTLEHIEGLKPDWICISPGPKDPAHAGISKAVVRKFGSRTPILGVCLGMQVINEVFGGKTVKAPVPVHGKCSLTTHSGRSLFAGIPSPLWVARYHSLCIKPRSQLIVPLAVAEDGVLMGIEHRFSPVYGVQFHPESFMSEYGLEVVENFLAVHPQWRAKGACSPIKETDRFPRLNNDVQLLYSRSTVKEAS